MQNICSKLGIFLDLLVLTYQKAWTELVFTLLCCSSTEYLSVGEKGLGLGSAEQQADSCLHLLNQTLERQLVSFPRL